MQILGWCRSNCWFCIVELCHLILEYILKCGYVIHHFNVHFLALCFLLMNYYLLFICMLDYRNDVRQKANSSSFLFFFFEFFFFYKKKNFIWSVHKNFNIVNLNSNIDTQTMKNIKEYHHTSFWQNKMVQVLVTKHCIVTFFLSND